MGSNDNMYDDGATKPVRKRIITVEEHESILAKERLRSLNDGAEIGERRAMERVNAAIDELHDHYMPYRPSTDSAHMVSCRMVLEELSAKIDGLDKKEEQP